MKTIDVGRVAVGNDRPLTVIAGPCQLEGRDHALMIAEKMAEICAAHGAGFIFKGGGFYETDYRSDSYGKDAKADKDAGASSEGKKDGGKSDKPKSGETKAAKSDSSSKKSDSKPAKKKD